MVFSEIISAKDQGYDIVVLPESVFPLFMNKSPFLIERLLLLSNDIAIVVGSLLSEDKQHYNVSYIFNEGKYQVAKKWF